ncbi:hypothetical protein [Desmospora activa]|uniref:Uncharacterized protein n=1 Tax=Desmospora activa DSM 45169 TaxID=1121389 RepID=A0A2T4ZD69_9BACL|nr:hypothetical protein [Desmospora activa]PTM59841.1 hypothetical protein C8J48_2475 [Desmospora activa DSM 45169]
MENPSWLFALASIIAVVGIVIVFKSFIGRLQAKGEEAEEIDLQREFAPFLLRVSLVEVVPLVLIAVGTMQIFDGTGSDIIFPLVLILGALLFGCINIFLTRQEVINNPRISEKGKMLLNLFCMVAIAFVTAIPLISVIIILTMQL